MIGWHHIGRQFQTDYAAVAWTPRARLASWRVYFLLLEHAINPHLPSVSRSPRGKRIQLA